MASRVHTLTSSRCVCQIANFPSRQTLSFRHGPPQRRRVALDAWRRQKWWSDSWEIPHSVDEEVVTVFGSDGTIITIPPIPISLYAMPRATSGAPHSLPTASEQGLCIGSMFTISATNGQDPTRRMNVVGFCQSIEILYERVEYTVARRGGEIMASKRELKSGIHEQLTVALALPLLWGVPPEHERLKSGIESGGGIIERIYREWFLLG